MSTYPNPVPGQRTPGADQDGPALTPEEVRAAAAARRKERKAARAHAPAPERDPAYDSLSLDDLRALRAQLADEETKVSYWRRIIQARLDVLRAGGAEVDRVADLSRVLSDAPSMHRRLVHLSVGPIDDVPPLPDLAHLWSREAGGDEAEREALASDLLVAERRLSEVRAGLFRRIDGVTGELIARYREEPTLALTALPHEALSLRI
jgi:hypothetical protein